jgi:hypothetical protein
MNLVTVQISWSKHWPGHCAHQPVYAFFIEHNKGHHKNVATKEDPATARL